MPLIKSVLELQILAAFQNLTNSQTDMSSAQQSLAKDLATAIDVYIKSATIIVPPGQAVAGSVTSTPAPPAIIS